ncbi:glycine N-acyltransferase-like protein 3 isoform X4 [Chelonia mydas]|uniref:glycine N-acyltransferase-like protein 3 isoform X4 n=1 Tax=Chelonia mydas TaxID=8469 RepID=UPI001CA86FF4|nr:glycine N-acyltransferase-like protein 3 isoform X4 [Chelonia mydas]
MAGATQTDRDCYCRIFREHRGCTQTGAPNATTSGSYQGPISTEMLILSCSSKLQLLEATLQRLLPETLQVLSVVMNINRGNPAGHEVLVDTWPEFKAILTRPHREQVASDDADFYTNTYAAFYRDLGANRALLGSAVNWGQAFCILGLQNGVYEASRDIAKAKAVQLEASRYFTYLHPDPSTMPEIRVCLLDAAGCPVSWIITDPFGIMTHGYTLPQHRGRGYIQVLLNVMAKQMHAWGYPSYGHVAVDNYPMQRLQERQGFQCQLNWCHFILHNTALHRTPTLTPSPAAGIAPA